MNVTMPLQASTLELFGAPTGNCRRAAIALSEAGLAYTVRRVDLRGGEQRREPFLALNPAGKVPILVQSTDQGQSILTQSNAIIFHAAAVSKHDLLPDDPPIRQRCLEAFFYFTNDVINLNGCAFMLKSRGQDDAASLLTERYIAAIVASERFLGAEGFMGGRAFSVADIAAFTIVTAVADRLAWPALPRLAAWRERIAARSGVQKGMQAFG
jgi:GST-like protein